MSSPFSLAPFSLRYPYLSFFFPPVLLPPVPATYFPTNVTNQFNISSLLPAVDGFRSPLKSLRSQLKCPHCSQSFETAPLLDLHLLIHQPLVRLPATPTVSETVSTPTSTSSTSPNSNSATASVSSSKSPTNCQCQVCGKTFSRHWLLQGHIRTHTGEKPFKCHICTKAFADKSNLRAHIQTHSGVKPFACDRCGKRFALKSYLSKHEESTCLRSAMKARQMMVL